MLIFVGPCGFGAIVNTRLTLVLTGGGGGGGDDGFVP
jgi:hypothetical protein